MAEPLPTEPQLFELNVIRFELFMKCLLISGVVLGVVALVLIGLCCWETWRETRKTEGTIPQNGSRSWRGRLGKKKAADEAIALLALCLSVGTVQSSESRSVRVPLGLDEFIPVPEDNPRTPEKIELGRRLFFDKQLSRDGTLACASCHQPERAFTSDGKVATGIDNRRGTRNAPTLLNRAYGKSFFWDGRAQSLEAQALEPIQNPKEMDVSLQELELRLNRAEEYHPAFTAVFGERPNARNAAKALATFVRTLLSGNSAFDRFEHGDQSALSESAKRGLQIFRGKGNCIACHSGPLLSDEDFHNTGVNWGREPLDLGRFEMTKREPDRGKFKTPGLRNVALTAPYMHDGSLATLGEVIEFYSKATQPNPHLDREIRPINLATQEQTDLVAFLQCLTSESWNAGPVRPNSE